MFAPTVVSAFRALAAPARPAPPAGAGVRTEDAPRPAIAGDTLSLSPAAKPASAPAGAVRLRPGTDTFTVTVQPGETLWRLATRWGALGSTRAFVEVIRTANGLPDSTIKAGQRLVLPYDPEHSGLNQLVAMAIQKDLAGRQGAPDLDLQALDVGPGPLDTYLCTAPRRDGKGVQRFAISDDQTGEDPLRWDVRLLTKAEYEARRRGEL